MAILAHYKFNGDVTDELGNYDGTPVNCSYAENDTFVVLNGVDSYITTPTISLPINYSVSIWATYEGNGSEALVGNNSTADPSIIIGINDTYMYIGQKNPDGYGYIEHNLGTWTIPKHLVVIQDASGNNLRCYIDNVEYPIIYQGTIIDNGYIDRIGQWYNSDVEDYDYTGKVSELKIFNSSLTVGEVEELYNLGPQGVILPSANILSGSNLLFKATTMTPGKASMTGNSFTRGTGTLLVVYAEVVLVSQSLVSFKGQQSLPFVPLSSWPLESNFLDTKGLHDGTAHGAVSTDGESASFGGSNNDYVIMGPGIADFKINQFTMTVWVKFDVIDSSTRTLMDNNARYAGPGNSYNSGASLKLAATNKFQAEHVIYNSETTTDSNGNEITSYTARANSSFLAVADTWYHAVTVTDNNNTKLYIDGLLASEVTSVQNIVYSTHDDNFAIGALTYDSARYYPLDGNLKKANFFARALNADEIETLFISESEAYVYLGEGSIVSESTVLGTGGSNTYFGEGSIVSESIVRAEGSLKILLANITAISTVTAYQAIEYRLYKRKVLRVKLKNISKFSGIGKFVAKQFNLSVLIKSKSLISCKASLFKQFASKPLLLGASVTTGFCRVFNNPGKITLLNEGSLTVIVTLDTLANVQLLAIQEGLDSTTEKGITGDFLLPEDLIPLMLREKVNE